MADGRKNHQIYAVVRGGAGGRVMFAPVDRYLVSSGRQPCPELLCECFKSAVVRRNSSSPQNGYFHKSDIRFRISIPGVRKRKSCATLWGGEKVYLRKLELPIPNSLIFKAFPAVFDFEAA
jgi:hypothetical protein